MKDGQNCKKLVGKLLLINKNQVKSGNFLAGMGVTFIPVNGNIWNFVIGNSSCAGVEQLILFNFKHILFVSDFLGNRIIVDPVVENNEPAIVQLELVRIYGDEHLVADDRKFIVAEVASQVFNHTFVGPIPFSHKASALSGYSNILYNGSKLLNGIRGRRLMKLNHVAAHILANGDNVGVKVIKGNLIARLEYVSRSERCSRSVVNHIPLNSGYNKTILSNCRGSHHNQKKS